MKVRNLLLYGHQPVTRANLPAPTCDAHGCIKSTRGGKPFCSAHIFLSPYIQHLFSVRGRIEEERERLERGGRVTSNGELVRELSRTVTSASVRSVGRLAALMQLSSPDTLRVARAAERAGLVSLIKRSRSVEIVQLRAGLPPPRDPRRNHRGRHQGSISGGHVGDARLRDRREQLRAGLLPPRDPRRNPIPGDVVRCADWRRQVRLVVPCGHPDPHGWQGIGPAHRCNLHAARGVCIAVHWERVEGGGYRANDMMLTSWRAWARKGIVLARAEAK